MSSDLAKIRTCKICRKRKPRDQFPAGRGFSCHVCVSERIPSLPFATYLTGVADRMQVGYLWSSHHDPLIEAACRRAGIDARMLSMWRTGGRPYLQFDAADRLLLNLGVLWWDVFTEETVRRPVLTASVWRPRWKLTRGPVGRCRTRELVETVRYGDAGPDHAELARIQRAFEGDPLEAVA